MRLLLATAAVLAPLVLSAAEGHLDDDDRKWLLEVKPLLLDDEQKILASLRTKPDRIEFRKIFWARRDPDLLTETNELQPVYERRRADADKLFYTSAYVPVGRSTDRMGAQPRASTDVLAGPATADMEDVQLRQYRDQRERPAMDGGLTDCGLFYIVLGEPDEITKRPRTVWGTREPQVWRYKAKESQFLFDEACMLPVGNDKVRRQAKQYAVVQPTIDYHVKGGELLKKLADMLPKITPVAHLLLAPRADFEIATQLYFLKVEEHTGVLGLVRGNGASLFREQAVGKARLIVRAEAMPAGNAARAVGSEREMLVSLEPDGTFVASYRIGARPGRYQLRVAVLDVNSNKGTVLSQPLEVPDFTTGSLTVGPILALDGIEDGAKKDPRHPMESFRFGDQRFVPRFGHVFRRSDVVTLSYQFYDPALDPATRRASTVAKLRILREDGNVVGEGPEDTFDTVVSGTLVGPVSLARYSPGRYTVQLTITDNVAGKIHVRESAFEVQTDTPRAF